MPMVSKEELGLGEVKVGDELTFKVAKVEGDNIELSYAPVMEEEMPVTEENLDKVPLESLEKTLPKAER